MTVMLRILSLFLLSAVVALPPCEVQADAPKTDVKAVAPQTFHTEVRCDGVRCVTVLVPDAPQGLAAPMPVGAVFQTVEPPVALSEQKVAFMQRGPLRRFLNRFRR